MCLRSAPLAVLLAALACLAAGPAAAASDAAAECRRLAAYGHDPAHRGRPVAAEALDAEAARAACTRAVAGDPGDAALRFHLARAHWRLGEAETAWLLLEGAADAGHAGAYYVIGRLFHDGAHVRRDHAAALLHYLEAARRGASAGVAGALAIYADPGSPSHDPAKAQVLSRDPSAAWMRHRQAAEW